MEEGHHRAARPKDLAALRTVMAADRTLMAWIRTALSMYSFGFTIYKFLQALEQAGQLENDGTPRRIGIFLATLGTTSIIFGTVGYWATLREMQMSEEFRIGRPVLVMALIMAIAGVLLVLGMAERAI